MVSEPTNEETDMDPHANVVEAMSLARDLLNQAQASDGVGEFGAAVTTLAELVIAQHDWRTNGGFDPYADPNAPVANPQANALLDLAMRWRSIRVFTTPGVASLPEGYVYVCEHANPPSIDCGIAPDGSVSS